MPKKVEVEGNPDRPINVNIQPVKALPAAPSANGHDLAEVRRT